MRENRSELEGILAEYRPRIHGYLTRLVGAEEAEDLTQEVAFKISRALKDFDGRARLSTWIYRIATNTAVDRLRSASYRRSRSEIPEEELVAEDRSVFRAGRVLSTDQRLIEQEMNACIRRFVDDLPAPYRAVLILSEWEGLKDRQIADILGLSLGTAKIRLHRARARLKKVLQQGCEFYRTDGDQLACEPTAGSSTAAPPGPGPCG